MPPRQLGGGRVLGSGRSLAPPPPPPPPNHQHHQRSSSLVSASESAVSSSSTPSPSPLGTSPIPDAAQDLQSRISLDNGGLVAVASASAAASAAASSKLVCPICSDEMVTLLQLNRHLDDNHQELPAVEQDEVKNWFNKQVVKAKRFQPLAVINQKLKGLDVFESNEVTVLTPSIGGAASQTTTPGTRPAATGAAAAAAAAAGHEVAHQPDPDEVVTRSHWQKPSTGYNASSDLCTEPACGKRLGAVNGSVNCRKCGRLFCEDHSMYQIKLSRSAQHEPVRGYWCRVCETCYKSREGYNDHNGLVRDHSKDFMAIRQRRVDKSLLEVSRLEKRLTKLTQLLANPPVEYKPGNEGLLAPVASLMKNQRKALEQSVVVWEDDATVLKCPFCQQEFGSWSFRRHHCRLCGRVVCADPRTGCSSEIKLDVTSRTDATATVSLEKPGGQQPTTTTAATTTLDIRMCRDCSATLFGKAQFLAAAQHRPADQRAYENLLQFEKGIRLLLPSFQRALVALQDPDRPPSHAQLAEAAKVRKRLIDSFGKYDAAAKRIRDLPVVPVPAAAAARRDGEGVKEGSDAAGREESRSAQARLQRAVYQQASSFLHLHMLPLKSLPKVLKHASPHGLGPAAAVTRNNNSNNNNKNNNKNNSNISNNNGNSNGIGNGRALASIRYNDIDAASSQASNNSSANSAAVSALEAEETELRERLIVLEEQRFLVGGMLAEAGRRRRLDEAASLTAGVDDLNREIDRVGGMLAQLDFAGAYAAPAAGAR